MKDRLKSRTYVQNAPRISHRWGADLRERKEAKEAYERSRDKAHWEYVQSLRYGEYLHLCNTIIRCRTSRGKVGVEYPVLRKRLREWDNNHQTTPGEWTGIAVCLVRHNIDHL